MIPFGKAQIVQEGTDLTVVTYGAVVQRALVAAREVEETHGLSVEVIDLRSLSPVDWETIYQSVRKTSRVIVAYEDSLSWGYGVGDRRAHRRRSVHGSRRPGAPGRRHRHLRGLRSPARRRHPAPGRSTSATRCSTSRPSRAPTGPSLDVEPAEHRLGRLVQQVRRPQLVEPIQQVLHPQHPLGARR